MTPEEYIEKAEKFARFSAELDDTENVATNSQTAQAFAAIAQAKYLGLIASALVNLWQITEEERQARA